MALLGVSTNLVQFHLPLDAICSDTFRKVTAFQRSYRTPEGTVVLYNRNLCSIHMLLKQITLGLHSFKD